MSGAAGSPVRWARGSFSWTDDRVEALRRLALDGFSASRIAEELGGGMTRNGVIGKAARTGISLGRDRLTPTRRVIRTPKARNCSPAKPRVERRAPPRRPATPTQASVALEVTLAVQARRVSFAALEKADCRYPLGDPRSPDFVFCGSPALAGRPYCAGHCALVFRRND